jgi:phosphate transport system protein
MQTRGLLSREINKIRQELMFMAVKVEEDLEKALTVLRSGGDELVKEIKEGGKTVDALQLKIEEMAMVLIATQQPVARDLRELIMVFKFTSCLERIGDYGIHLVKAAVKLAEKPPFASITRIERMAEIGQEMLKAAFRAYLDQDVDAARKAALLDDQIDEQHKALTEEILKLMKKNPELVKPAARLLRLSGFMERLGDHVTNICEGIVFMIQGKHEELNV